MISVVIPAYNARDELPFSLGSILLQELEDWECVIVDDGSDVPIDDVVEAANDPRIRLVKHVQNQGRGAARRTGLEAARGELFAWQDADDWSMPARLAKQMSFFADHPSTDFVGTGMIIADASDRCIGVRPGRYISPRKAKPLQQPPVGHPSLVFRKEVLERHGYEPKYHTAEDHAFLVRALVEHEFASLAEPLYCYREFQSQSPKKYWESTKTRLKVVAENLPKYPLRGSIRGLTYLTKAAAYAAVSRLGGQDYLLRRRSTPPLSDIVKAYEQARRDLHTFVCERFRGVE